MTGYGEKFDEMKPVGPSFTSAFARALGALSGYILAPLVCLVPATLLLTIPALIVCAFLDGFGVINCEGTSTGGYSAPSAATPHQRYIDCLRDCSNHFIGDVLSKCIDNCPTAGTKDVLP